MNRRLHAVLPSGMYVAAAVFFLESDSADISFANAGLPYPFVLRTEGRVDEIALAGPPLGLFETGVLPYECRRISTRPGNVVLAGSDGIGSIFAPGGEMFEDAELRRTLEQLAGEPGERVIERLMERGLEFGAGAPLPDDVNLVAVTRS